MIIKPIENNKRDMVDEDEDDDDEVDWSALPYHMVELMMDKLMTADDYIRCGAVCTSWRTIFIDRHHHHRVHVTLPPPPVLVVPTPKELNKRKNKKKKKKEKNNKKKKTKSFGFYSIISKKVINQFQVTIPNNRYFRGSSYGWLVAVDNDSQIRLFNPFFLSPPSAASSSSRSNNNYNNEILLPSLKHLPCDPYLYPYPYGPDENPPYCTHLDLPSSYSYLRKAILSADPLSNPIDYIVMAIFGPIRELAFCRPGHHDKTWTLVDHNDDESMYHHDYDFQNYDFQDVIYYKGFFFALQTHGPLVVLDPARNMMAVVTLQIPPIDSRLMINGPKYDTLYLVELEGVLLQVLRLVEAAAGDNDTVIMKRQPYSTTSFQVFELQGINDKNNFDIANVNDHQDGKELNWKLVKNLRGHTLFLGDNDSICVRASDYPGCRPNSIYFTDDYLEMYHCRPWNGPHDLGVFNLENNTIENHYPTNHNTPIWPVPIWIQPSIACR